MDKPISISFKSLDGLECYMYIRPCKKESPCILEIPAGVYGIKEEMNSEKANFFSNLDEFLNSKGFSVVRIDKRGCKGYGDFYRNQIDYCGKDVEDIVEGTKTIFKEGILSPSKIGIYGTCSSSLPVIKAMNKWGKYDFGISVMGVYNLILQSEFEKVHYPEILPYFKFLGIKELTEFPYQERRLTKEDFNFSSPLFILHGADDSVSPVHHSRLLAKDLKNWKVNFEYHEFSSLPHDRSSVDPTTESGIIFWDKIFNFLKRNKIL